MTQDKGLLARGAKSVKNFFKRALAPVDSDNPVFQAAEELMQWLRECTLDAGDMVPREVPYVYSSGPVTRLDVIRQEVFLSADIVGDYFKAIEDKETRITSSRSIASFPAGTDTDGVTGADITVPGYCAFLVVQFRPGSDLNQSSTFTVAQTVPYAIEHKFTVNERNKGATVMIPVLNIVNTGDLAPEPQGVQDPTTGTYKVSYNFSKTTDSARLQWTIAKGSSFKLSCTNGSLLAGIVTMETPEEQAMLGAMILGEVLNGGGMSLPVDLLDDYDLSDAEAKVAVQVAREELAADAIIASGIQAPSGVVTISK